MAQAYWALQLNQHAIVLALTAPYDTVQLAATPLNAAGMPMLGLGPVTFTTTDSSLIVSPTGLVRARLKTPDGLLVPVVASLRDSAQGVTHWDTAFVVVTTTPAATGMAMYSMQPAQGDSAKRPLSDGFLVQSRDPWPVTAIDSANTTLCGLGGCSIPVYYHASNPAVATIDPHTGTVTKTDTGHVWLSAQTLYYGQALHDSVHFRVGLMTDALVFLRPHGFAAGETNLGPKITLGVGGFILFYNQAVYGPIQITFSDPTFADTVSLPGLTSVTGSGDITYDCVLQSGQFFPDCFPTQNIFRARRFPRPGTVEMHVSAFGGYPARSIQINVVQE